MNNEYERKKEQYGNKRTELEIQDRKKKVFLVHRKQILQNIRSKMESEHIEEYLNKKRIKRLLMLMSMQKVCKDLLFWFQARLDAIEYKKFQKKCALKIIRKLRNKALKTGGLI